MGKSMRKIWIVKKVQSTGEYRPHIKRDGEYTIHEARVEADRLNARRAAEKEGLSRLGEKSPGRVIVHFR